jgi:hypothetical protein
VTAERDSPRNRGASCEEAERFVTATRDWLEKAVIGLGLCPFAEHAYRGGLLRFKVSGETSTSGLVKDLVAELQHLHGADPAALETTLLIHPHVLGNFDDYNQFLDEADATVCALGFEHLLREASVTRAVECFPGVHEIGNRNAATLSALGHAGWRRLWMRE